LCKPRLHEKKKEREREIERERSLYVLLQHILKKMCNMAVKSFKEE
jgi:hypothetical protein